MGDILYTIFINFLACFIIWAIWFFIAFARKNKKQMFTSSVMCSTFFILRVIGIIIAIVFFASCYALKGALTHENKNKTADEVDEDEK